MELEVRHLRVLCAVADHGSLSAAARALGLSQPGLTTQLQRIERHFGGAVFLRGRWGAVATPLGEVVLARARVALAAVEQVRGAALDYTAATGTGRPWRYGAVAGPLMAGVLQHADTYPVGAITLRTEPSSRMLAELVADGYLDFAALLEYENHPVGLTAGLRRHVVAVEPAFVLLPEHAPLARAEELDLRDVAGAEWVLPPGDDNGLRDSLIRACAQAGFSPRLVHEADAAGARDLVAAGRGLGVGQACFRATQGIVPRPLAGSPLRIRHVLLWRDEAPSVDIAVRMCEAAHMAYADSVQHSPAYLVWLDRHSPLANEGHTHHRNGRDPTATV